MRIRSWRTHPDFPVSTDSPFRGFWEYELKGGENTVPHQHGDGHEINIALEGVGRITVADVTRDLRPGEVIFIPPQTTHSIENPFAETLRGLSIESGLSILDAPQGGPVTARDLDQVIEEIPWELNEAESIQLIIHLFDLAGHLSEQIESAIGLDSETGLEALKGIEKKVMNAVVEISSAYQGGGPLFPSRF